jgi:hypothetical protein
MVGALGMAVAVSGRKNMKTINIDHNHSAYDGFEPMWFQDIHRMAQEQADKIAPEPSTGFDVWGARKRRKIVRGTVEGVSVVHSLHRDPYVWRVYQTREVASEHFVAVIEQWWAWEHYDPAKPFPYDCYNPEEIDSIWNDITGEHCDIKIRGSLAHFLAFAKLDREDAQAIIDQCEDDGEIDATDAMLARFSL